MRSLLLVSVVWASAFVHPTWARGPVETATPTPAVRRLAFTSRDGLALSYVRYSEVSATLHPIVISPGCGESAYRYEELVADLRARGYGPIYVLEHRGQGYSAGSGVRTDLVYVDRFDRYVADFTDFVRGPVARDLASLDYEGAPDVIAHSMGGAIANLALDADPSLARKVAYVAPMMDINTAILNPMQDQLALWAAEALCAAGFCENFAVGGLGRARRMKIPGVPREIQEGIFRGGVTPGWLKEAILATRQIQRRMSHHAEPSLMITATRDRLVGNKVLRAYAVRARNCVLREIDGPHGLHHLPRSRAELVAAIDGFFGGCEGDLTVASPR